MSLLFLSSDDFSVFRDNQSEKNLLCHDISGFSLVLFYSNHCEYCGYLIPIFKTLPNILKGCHFAMINVSQNQQIIQMSNYTITPLEYVPYIILYIDGKPYMRYDGAPDLNDIRSFIIEISNSFQNKFNRQDRHEDNKNVKNVQGSIPSYTIGVPLCGFGERHYLKYDHIES
jgi:thiol-disulfide isomerase/thioredoxin